MAKTTSSKTLPGGDAYLNQLRKHIRFDLGTQTKTKLARCGYPRATKTLLQPKVAAHHLHLLFARFQKKWGHFKKAEQKRRLRFLTVLGSVEKVDVAAIRRGIEALERDLRKALKPFVGVTVLGVIEIEVFNLSVLEQIASDSKNEQRKLKVLKEMRRQMAVPQRKLFDEEYVDDRDDPSQTLVHLHAVVDLGKGADGKDEGLAEALRKKFPDAYRVELKKLFDDNEAGKNLRQIATYLTKGGNGGKNKLRYYARFGGEKDESVGGAGALSADKLDHQIWRSGGLGSKRRNKSEDDGSVEDTRSLTFYEVAILAESIDWLMSRKMRRDGFQFTYDDMERNYSRR